MRLLEKVCSIYCALKVLIGKDSNSTEHSLDSLQNQRISRIRNMYQDGSASTNPIALECRLEILRSYIKQIMAYPTEIEKINPDDTKSGEIEEVCIGAKLLLLLKLGSRR